MRAAVRACGRVNGRDEMSSGGGTLLRGAAGGGGAGGGSSSKVGANATSAADGVLTPTVDSPADSEWRSRRGPLDGVGEISGPWEDEDSTGARPEHPSRRSTRPSRRPVENIAENIAAVENTPCARLEISPP